MGKEHRARRHIKKNWDERRERQKEQDTREKFGRKSSTVATDHKGKSFQEICMRQNKTEGM